MEFIDKIGDTLVSVSKDATQKAKDISELAKLRIDIRSKKDHINKLYQEMGKAYYEEHKNEEEPDYDQIVLIKEAEEALAELKKQVGQLKGMQRCPKCGQDMPLDADYCSKCGEKLDIFEEE